MKWWQILRMILTAIPAITKLVEVLFRVKDKWLARKKNQ